MAVEGVLGYLRIRIVSPQNSITGQAPAEIVANLAHLHQCIWTIRGMQPGAPGSVAIGDFVVKLHPPGSEGYAANFASYQLLFPGAGEGLRVEAYMGDSDTLSAPTFAGIITDVDLSEDGVFELHGFTDAWVLQAQHTYPGEIIHNSAYDTINVVNSFLSSYVLGPTDQFSPYVAANYANLNLPSLTAGAWTAGTDANGINSNVVQNSTGTGAVLLLKTSSPTGDQLNTQIVEGICRLHPTSGLSTTNAGQAGIGMSFTNANANDCIVAYVTARWNTSTSRYDLDAHIDTYVSGVLTGPLTISSALIDVDDADGYIPLNLQLIQQAIGGVGTIRFIVNGSPVNAVGTGTTYLFNPFYPFFMYGTPAAGAAGIYFTNLLCGYRQQGPSLGQGYFRGGTNGTPVHKFRVNQTPPSTFLDMLTLGATVEGWLWRMTPLTVTNSQSGLVTVDLNASPGTDLSQSVIFEYGRNLLSLKQRGNADTFGSDLQFNGAADPSSGGIHYGRNIAAMKKYGWLSGTGMSLTVQDYVGLMRQGAQVVTNKGTPGASYVARVLRDPATADKFRELDYVTIHNPRMGVNMLKVLVLARMFTEGSPEETLTLGQYGQADLVNAKRVFPGTALMAGLFKNR